MKPRKRQAKAARVAADLVERRQAKIAIERGVLGGFRHYRAGDLLELHCDPQRVVVAQIAR